MKCKIRKKKGGKMKEVNSGSGELGFSLCSSTISNGGDSLHETRGGTLTVEEVADCDFERNDCEKSDEVCEKKGEERGMKNRSDLTSLHEGRQCTVAAVELDTDNGDWEEMGEDLPNDDFENEGEERDGEKEIKIGLETLSLHEARECTKAVEIDMESNGNEKEKKEQGPDCDFEKNGGDKNDEIREKKEGEIENGSGISLHEMREYAAKLELYAESNGDLKEKREEGPDCNFEKIDVEKRYGICEKEEGEKEMENGLERECIEQAELNTENVKSKEKIEEGPDCNFEKQAGEMKNEMERGYAEKVELHIENNEKSKEKIEEGPDCNFEKQGDEKNDEILDKKGGENEMKNQIKREFTAKVELNTEENGDVNGKVEQGPDCNFDKVDAEKNDEIHDKKKGEGKNGEFKKKEGEKVKYALPYPREGKQDCPNYLKSGFCSYGYKCCFNHPPNIANQFSPKSSQCSDETYEQEETNKEAQLRSKWVKKDEIYEQKQRESDFEKKQGAKVKYALPYPQRKGRPDCDLYLKTGFCNYGFKCCYNHPNQISSQFSSGSSWDYDDMYETEKIDNSTQYVGLPIRPGQIDCPYYMKHGSCKYSINCRYNHPNHYEDYQNNQYIENSDPLNYGEPSHFIDKQGPHKEYQNNEYLENNDPLNYEDPHEECQNNDPFIYEDSSLSESARSNVLLPINIKSMVLPKYEGDLPPNVKAMLLPPQRLHDTEQVSVSISSSETYEGYLMDSSTSKSKSNSSEKSKSNPSEKSTSNSSEKSKSNSTEQQMEGPFEFPERPGKEECAFYMKCGDCKFKSSCKFHHPKDRLLKKDYIGRTSYRNNRKSRLYDAIETQERLMSVQQKGLREHQFPSEAYGEENFKNGKIKQKKREIYPERPGKTLCEYYMKHGDCKFKYTCKFHHPKDQYEQDLIFHTSNSEYRGCT